MKNSKVFSIEVRVNHCYEGDDNGTITLPVKAFIGEDGEIVLKLLNGATLYAMNDQRPRPYDDARIVDRRPSKETVQYIRLERRRERARRRQYRDAS
jgi:hypothetical protein